MVHYNILVVLYNIQYSPLYHTRPYIQYCGRRCLAALNKFHKSQQNEIERIRGIVLKNIYTCDFDIDYSSEPSSNKL